MALSAVERVRYKIADRAQLRRERFTADGVSDHFKLKQEPILQSTPPQVWQNGTLLVEDTDYSVDYTNGVITFANAPAANLELIFQYYSIIWSDTEIQDFLDQYSANVNVAAAHILLAWAADVARLSKRETRSGGGGVGAVTVDTSLAARELRNTAKAILDWEIEYGESLGSQIPAEGITQVPWTESAAYDIEYQRFLRESD